MNLEQKIDRILTEYNFDRMSFDEAKQKLLNLHSVMIISRNKWRWVACFFIGWKFGDTIFLFF